ncbi:hypothetical protein CTAYLR_005005 [Chrysophaeum taylorii]|uniref:RING-type domain-containing protein n=1 Tax=Chrysophaeum taylorii TaxID=2483200 RepID=A0AAD7XMI3_9STRA|nr:hypothetical protein CTAYLR_005005 [Chrysophaeum taylorii]
MITWWAENNNNNNNNVSKIVERHAECQICCELLFEPSSTVCGHTFCRRCLCRAMQHSTKCPTCRTTLSTTTPVINSTLHHLLEELVPERYASRAAGAATDPPTTTTTTTRGLFVLDHLLPRQRFKLHVFEQRYRRLIATALRSTPSTFGVVGQSGRSISRVFTECEVVDHALLPDGRYLCEVVGRRRWRILRDWDGDDGYRVAAVEPCVDAPVDDDDRERLATLASDVAAQVGVWCDRVRTGGWERTRHHLDGILDDLGPMPPLADAENFSLWVGALVNPVPVLGVAPEIREEILLQTSTVARLATIFGAIKRSNDFLNQRSAGGSGAIRAALALLGFLVRLVVVPVARGIALPLALFARFVARPPQRLYQQQQQQQQQHGHRHHHHHHTGTG